MRNFSFFERGFTLIELLVVITVLGVLAGIVLVTANPVGQYNKARDGQRKSDIKQIQAALEFYRTDAGKYPDNTTSIANSCGNAASLTYNLNGNTQTYLNKIPCDPSTKLKYQYYSDPSSNNTTYCLRACLQVDTDKDRDEANSNYGSTNDPTVSGCTLSNCAPLKSYTVTNP